MILHIPHSSRIIPEDVRHQFVLSDDELDAELTLMTDCFVDELFAVPRATTVRFPISRLVVDVERFADDAQEPMARVGMGVVYTRTAHGKRLRRELQPHEREDLIARYYDTHHAALVAAVQAELDEHGKALIIDCHSFPSRPLPCDMDQSVPRPGFCIGTDPFHTPERLVDAAVQQRAKVGTGTEKGLTQRREGAKAAVNRPYSGALVPAAFYRRDISVMSLMVEVNRSLYMNEPAGTKTSAFDAAKDQAQTLLRLTNEFRQHAGPNPRSH